MVLSCNFLFFKKIVDIFVKKQKYGKEKVSNRGRAKSSEKGIF